MTSEGGYTAGKQYGPENTARDGCAHDVSVEVAAAGGEWVGSGCNRCGLGPCRVATSPVDADR